MKTRIETWDESILDLEDFQVERALTIAALDAIRRARKCGTDFVVEEDGKTISLRPEQTGAYEKRFLQDLDRLNRKIAELQNNPVTLNDRPPKQ